MIKVLSFMLFTSIGCNGFMVSMQVIADNVGDNVGDIAGMGSDLFGSYAESSCAALFVASISSFGISHDYTAMSFPLIISSVGIVVCLITTLFATDLFKIKDVSEIEPSLKRQLVVSTILMTVGIAMVSFFALPSEFTIFNFGTEKVVKNWYATHQKSLFPFPMEHFVAFHFLD
jgi:inorganic pyrophosphatase